MASAEPPSTSAAKLSAGACRMGTKSGLLPRDTGIPENHTGGKSLLKIFEALSWDEGEMGMSDAGSLRLGK